jgi:hypothetical protein
MGSDAPPGKPVKMTNQEIKNEKDAEMYPRR